jgi:hypothetical protein
MTSVCVTSLVHLADDEFPARSYRGSAGDYPRHDHGIVRHSIWTALHSVVGYAKHVVAQVLDTCNARNVGIGNGDRLDHRQVDVHFALSLPAQVDGPFHRGEYDGLYTKSSNHNRRYTHSAITPFKYVNPRHSAPRFARAAS